MLNVLSSGAFAGILLATLLAAAGLGQHPDSPLLSQPKPRRQ
jgi:hypothetical protein